MAEQEGEVLEKVESAATPERQKEAEAIGWIPPARYKGDPETYVDAEEFIKRGETVLPIIKETNKRLRGEIDTLRGENAKIVAALQKAETAIADIEERHTVATQKAVDKAKAEVKTQLAAASEAGDHEGVAELTEQMVKLNATDGAAAEKKEVKRAPPAAPVIPPEVIAWNERNKWFGTDVAKTDLALGVARELHAKGETARGEDFFNKVGEIVARRYRGDDEEEPPPARESKVEGGRNGSGSGGNGSAPRGKSFASLPADAKAACRADAKTFVGPTKRYKTAAEWESRYAEIYYQQES